MLQPDSVLKEQPKTDSKSSRSIMERLTLSDRFAGIRIDADDNSDDDADLIAMREKYLLGINNSTSVKSKTCKGPSDEIDEKLEMDSDWSDHFQNLLEKCKSLTPGVCFSYLGEDSDSDLVDEIQGIIDRLDHDSDDAADDDDVVDNDDDNSKTAARDKKLDHDSDDDVVVDDNASESNTAASPKLLESEICEKPGGNLATAKNDDSEAVIHNKTDKEPEHVASDHSNDVAERDIAEKKTENVTASPADKMSETVDVRPDAGDSISETAVNNEAADQSTKVDECSETNKNNAMPAKTVAKKKDAKVVKKFDIKPPSSFPLDELLPVIEKTHAKSNESTEVPDDTKEPDLDCVKSDDKSPTNDEHPETFHGSLFDYSDSENEAEKDQPDINPKDINTRSSFIETGLNPNKAQVSSDYNGMPSNVNAQQYGFDQKPRSVCFDTNLSESTIPTYISERPIQNYYTAAGRRDYSTLTGSKTNPNLANVPMNDLDLDLRRGPVNNYNMTTGATNAFDMARVPTSAYYLPIGTLNTPNMPTVQMNAFDTSTGPMVVPNLATVPLNAFDMARRQINESTMASGMLNAPSGAMNVFDLANGTMNNMYNQPAMAPGLLYNPNVATGAMNNFNMNTGTINDPSSIIGPTSPLEMATGVKNDLNTTTTTYSSNVLPVAPDTSKIIQNTLNEIDVCDSPEECEMLLNTLNEQCSKLVASDEERFKLNEMIAALRAKVLDVAQAKKVLSDDTAYTPADPIIDNVGPAGDSFTPNSTESDLDIFEGRTLLKGGVEPRRIPKTTVKTYKTRPQDPRTYNTKKETVKIPLPQFSVELYGEKRVLRMMYLDWDAYSKEKGIVIDDSNYDANAADDDGDIKAFHEVTSPALDSMKYTLKTGNIEIAVQESFMGLNSTSLRSSSEMLAKLYDKDTLSQSSKHGSESTATKVNAQPISKEKSEDSNSNDYLSKVVSDWQSKQRAHNYGEKSTDELKKPEIAKKADIPNKMETDTDLEDGQVVTDVDSLSDVSSRNTIAGATPSDRELSDVEVTIVIPDTLPSFEKRNIQPSQDHLHHSRERTSSKSTSMASSISKESSSVTIPPHKSRSESRPEKRDHSYESSKHSGRYENYFLQVQENHKKAVEKLTKRKDSSHSSHSSHHHSKEPSLPSVEHQKHASHKQASRDSHSITSYAEAPHAMKRHHSLEEVGTKKRHKSGDMLGNNEIQITPGKTSKTNKTSGKTSTMEPVVYFDLTNDSKAQIPQNMPKANVHERLGSKRGHKTPTKYQNTHTPTSHLGHSNLHRAGLEEPGIPNPKTPVHERLGKPNVHNRLGYFTGQESSGSKNKTPSKKPIHIEVNHQFTIPGLNAQNLTKNSTPQAHKDQISKEYHEKYTSRRKPEISEPSQPVLVPKTKRRKSLEEQQKEKEDDLLFLQQLKSKITGKK